MSKKVNITIPDGVYAMLNDEAEKQGRTPANLAAFIVEHHLLFYRYMFYRFGGEKPESETGQKFPVKREPLIEKALTGVPLEDYELKILAENFNLDESLLTHFRNQNKVAGRESSKYTPQAT